MKFETILDALLETEPEEAGERTWRKRERQFNKFRARLLAMYEQQAAELAQMKEIAKKYAGFWYAHFPDD